MIKIDLTKTYGTDDYKVTYTKRETEDSIILIQAYDYEGNTNVYKLFTVKKSQIIIESGNIIIMRLPSELTEFSDFSDFEYIKCDKREDELKLAKQNI